MKGKAEPLPVFAVTDISRKRAHPLAGADLSLADGGTPGRTGHRGEKLELALQGHGQVIGITAEAGIGKSRLVAEAIRLAHRRGFAGYGGACESSGTNTAYLVWKPIWQAFFDIDPTMPVRRQLRNLEGEIEDRASDRLQALPLLAMLLDVPIEDNDFTRTLEPKSSAKACWKALLEDCLSRRRRKSRCCSCSKICIGSTRSLTSCSTRWRGQREPARLFHPGVPSPRIAALAGPASWKPCRTSPRSAS